MTSSSFFESEEFFKLIDGNFNKIHLDDKKINNIEAIVFKNYLQGKYHKNIDLIEKNLDRTTNQPNRQALFLSLDILSRIEINDLENIKEKIAKLNSIIGTASNYHVS